MQTCQNMRASVELYRCRHWHAMEVAVVRCSQSASELQKRVSSGCHTGGSTHADAAGVQATVIGGGYIGLETAAGLNKNGLDVTLVFPEKHVMERLFTPEIAQFYEKYYTDKGITLKSGSLATEFEGKDGVVRTLPSMQKHAAAASGQVGRKRVNTHVLDGVLKQ